VHHHIIPLQAKLIVPEEVPQQLWRGVFIYRSAAILRRTSLAKQPREMNQHSIYLNKSFIYTKGNLDQRYGLVDYLWIPLPCLITQTGDRTIHHMLPTWPSISSLDKMAKMF